MWLVPPEHWGESEHQAIIEPLDIDAEIAALRHGRSRMSRRSTSFDPVHAAHRVGRDPPTPGRRDPHRPAGARHAVAGRAGAVPGVRCRPHVGARGDPGPGDRRLPRASRQPLGRRRAPARDQLRRRRPQGAGHAAVRGAPGHRAGHRRDGRPPGHRRRARRDRPPRGAQPRTTWSSSARSTVGSTRRWPGRAATRCSTRCTPRRWPRCSARASSHRCCTPRSTGPR